MNARARNSQVEATLNHPCAAQVEAKLAALRSDVSRLRMCNAAKDDVATMSPATAAAFGSSPKSEDAVDVPLVAAAIANVEWAADDAAEAKLSGDVFKAGFLDVEATPGAGARRLSCALAPTTFDGDGVYVGPALIAYARGGSEKGDKGKRPVARWLLDGCVAVRRPRDDAGTVVHVEFPERVAPTLVLAAPSERDGVAWVDRGAGKGCDIGQLQRLVSRSFPTHFG